MSEETPEETTGYHSCSVCGWQRWEPVYEGLMLKCVICGNDCDPAEHQ